MLRTPEIERTIHPTWLSNSYLVYDDASRRGVLIDSGGPPGPLLAVIAKQGLRIDHILTTHHHGDHVANHEALRERLKATILAHPREQALLHHCDGTLEDGDRVVVGGIEIEALHIPGHTAGQLAFLINGKTVFTGDTLFQGSVGGTVAPGHTTFDDLRRSIMERLMNLPMKTVVMPGHTGATTIEREWNKNPFIRLWRGLDPPGDAPCSVAGMAATLILRAKDYDEGTKAWVRFEAEGDAIVPGSRVT